MVFYKILAIHEYLGHFLTIKGKKVGENVFKEKNRFLAIFVILEEITKTDKNSFFLWKGGIFFHHTLNIWENSTFSFSIIFDSIKKIKKSLFSLFWPKIAPPSTLRAKKSVKYKFSWKVYKKEIVTFNLIKNWYFIKYWPYMSVC